MQGTEAKPINGSQEKFHLEPSLTLRCSPFFHCFLSHASTSVCCRAVKHSLIRFTHIKMSNNTASMNSKGKSFRMEFSSGHEFGKG